MQIRRSVSIADSEKHGLAKENSPALGPAETEFVSFEDYVGKLHPLLRGRGFAHGANFGGKAFDWLLRGDNLRALDTVVIGVGNDTLWITDEHLYASTGLADWHQAFAKFKLESG